MGILKENLNPTDFKVQMKVFKTKQSKMEMWVHKILLNRKRHGQFQRLVHDLRLFDGEKFSKTFQCLAWNSGNFSNLL